MGLRRVFYDFPMDIHSFLDHPNLLRATPQVRVTVWYCVSAHDLVTAAKAGEYDLVLDILEHEESRLHVDDVDQVCVCVWGEWLSM